MLAERSIFNVTNVKQRAILAKLAEVKVSRGQCWQRSMLAGVNVGRGQS